MGDLEAKLIADMELRIRETEQRLKDALARLAPNACANMSTSVAAAEAASIHTALKFLKDSQADMLQAWGQSATARPIDGSARP